MSIHLTSDEMDLDAVELVRVMFRDDDTRQGQMIVALCNALERELRRNARLKEDMQMYKSLRYDGHFKEKHDT